MDDCFEGVAVGSGNRAAGNKGTYSSKFVSICKIESPAIYPSSPQKHIWLEYSKWKILLVSYKPAGPSIVWFGGFCHIVYGERDFCMKHTIGQSTLSVRKVIIWTNLVCVKVSHSGEDSLTCASWAPDGRRLAVVSKEKHHHPLFAERASSSWFIFYAHLLYREATGASFISVTPMAQFLTGRAVTKFHRLFPTFQLGGSEGAVLGLQSWWEAHLGCGHPP